MKNHSCLILLYNSLILISKSSILLLFFIAITFIFVSCCKNIKIDELHPGMSAKIILDKEEIGIIGRIHPNIKKDEIYVAEISLNKLIKPIKPLKYKEATKYPEVVKDLSFIVDKNVTCKELSEQIKKSGGRLLSNIEVFDEQDLKRRQKQ